MNWVRECLVSDCKRFVSDAQGVIAIMFAILAMPLLAGAFVAIDYGRATSLQTSLQTAADAAIYSAALRLGEDTGEVEAAFRDSFQANLPKNLKDQSFSLRIANDKKSLQVKMDAAIKTTLIKVAGIEEIRFEVEAFANKPELKLSTLARAAKKAARASDERALKDQLMREIQEGLRAARRAGLPVQDNMDQRQLELLADGVRRYMSQRR